MPSRPEKRRATRVATGIEAALIPPAGKPVPVRLRNLSVLGLLASTSSPLAPGLGCRVELRVGDRRVEASGRVVRAGEGKVALRFENLPYESFEELRAFLLSHAADPVVIDEELTDRLGFLGEEAA